MIPRRSIQQVLLTVEGLGSVKGTGATRTTAYVDAIRRAGIAAATWVYRDLATEGMTTETWQMLESLQQAIAVLKGDHGENLVRYTNTRKDLQPAPVVDVMVFTDLFDQAVVGDAVYIDPQGRSVCLHGIVRWVATANPRDQLVPSHHQVA